MTVTSFSPILGILTTETRSLHQHIAQGLNHASGHFTTYSYQSHTHNANVSPVFHDFWKAKSRWLGKDRSVVPMCKAGLNHEGAWHLEATFSKIGNHSGLQFSISVTPGLHSTNCSSYNSSHKKLSDLFHDPHKTKLSIHTVGKPLDSFLSIYTIQSIHLIKK